MEDIKRVLKIDLFEKYSVIKNEIRASNLTMDYLSSLGISKEFFQKTFQTTSILSEKISSIQNKIDNSVELLEKGDLWNFINERAVILRLFKNIVDAIGVVQKSLASRLGSLPHFFPPPPILRQKEIYKALEILDQITFSYSDNLKKLLVRNEEKEENPLILPVWDYMVDDQFITLKENDNWIELIKSTYWIVLLPRFLPILAHEVAHGYVNKKEDEIISEFNVNHVKQNLHKFFSSINREGGYTYVIESFVKEIISDVLALLIAGPPFVFTMFLYLLKEKVNYRLFGLIESFPILRLKLLASFAISKLEEEGDTNYSKYFHEYLRSIIRFCDEYYQLITDVKESVTRGIFSPDPNIYEECELKKLVDNALFKILSPYLDASFGKRSMVGKYDYHRMLTIIKKYRKGEYFLKYSDLKKSGIVDVTDIPILLWHFILSDNEKNKKRFESGRLCQETYRLLVEKKDNNFVFNRKRMELKLGRIVEFLFMKINWFSISSLDNPKEDLVKIFEKTLRESSLKKEHSSREDFFTREIDGEELNVSSPYDCLGFYDFLFITTDFSVKKIGKLDWPPDFIIEPVNHDKLKYFPKSEVFQEILIPANSEYPKTLEDFLDNANEVCLYQIQTKNDRDLASSIKLALDSLKRLRQSKDMSGLEIFLLKSIGWEDIVILFKNFGSLDGMKKIKEHFSELLQYSLTTLFYKGSKLRDSSRLSGAKVVSLLKVNNYKALYKLGDEKSKLYEHYILTGLYDCQLTWNLEPEKTIKDLDKCIFDFIKDHKELRIIDIYSSIAF